MATIQELYANGTFPELYQTWQEFARRPMILSAHERDYTEEEFERAVWGTHAMLRRLATHITDSVVARDVLVLSDKILIGSCDQRAFIDSEKMALRFDICADGYTVWLESRIIHPEHLRRMDDDFFDLLLGLRELGSWKFRSLGGDDTKIRSSVYHLVADAEAEDVSDFGALSLSWSFRTNAAEILTMAPRAFATLHQLQYRLYRAEYQLRAGRRRK